MCGVPTGIRLCQQMPLNCLQYFLKSFHFLFERLTSGRRNNGDASGVRLPSHRRKTEELLQQHRRKVHRPQDHWPGLQSRHTGERTEPRVRCSGVRMSVDRGRGLALGALPENQDVARRCWSGMLPSLSALDFTADCDITGKYYTWERPCRRTAGNGPGC